MKKNCRIQGFVEESKPDKVFWPNVKIKSMGSYTEKESISVDEFCPRKNNSVFVFTSVQLDYERSALFCNQLNGQMFYPSDKQHLDTLLSKFHQAVIGGCSKMFWVPFIRSSRNATKWIYDRKMLPETEITTDPWNKTNPTHLQLTWNCMYFNVELKVYQEVNCRTPMCVFCQIAEERQKFNLQSSCEKLLGLDKEYFLIQETEPIPYVDRIRFYFRGVKGLSQILMAKTDLNIFEAWTIDPFYYRTGTKFLKLSFVEILSIFEMLLILVKNHFFFVLNKRCDGLLSKFVITSHLHCS
jgi:hypothetical protein